MRVLLLFCLAQITLFSITQAGIINVPGEASTIQAGINLSKSGDTIQVASGTYAGYGNYDLYFAGKAVVLKSLSGPVATIIDINYVAQSGVGKRGFNLHSIESSELIIEGFTIRNGGGVEWGGGIYINSCSPTFRNCHIIDNRVPQGGGVYITDVCSPAFYDCVFKGNSCTNVGCAVLVRRSATAYFENCLFEDNYGSHGTFLCYDASPTLVNCQFYNNDIRNNGGAIFLQDNCSPSFSECVFAGNRGGTGGAIFIQERGVSGGSSEPTFTNCTFYGNESPRGSAIYCSGRGGPAIPVYTNCIIAFNTNDDAFSISEAQPLLYCTDIFGNPEGNWTDEIADQVGISGNFSLDPLFCDTTNRNFEISGSSPCAPQNNQCKTLIGALPVGCVNSTAGMKIFPDVLSAFHANTMDNLTATIYVGAISNHHNPDDIVGSSVAVNDGTALHSMEFLDPGLYFPTALRIKCFLSPLLDSYGELWDTTTAPLTVSGLFDDGTPFLFQKTITLVGHISGDANSDNIVDVGDPVFILRYVFNGGREPIPLMAAEVNDDGLVDVGDVVYLINYIFRSGPPPGGNQASQIPIPR